MNDYELIGPERRTLFGDRWRTVRVGAVTYHVGVVRGRPVRIAFKPRGHNRGFKWHAIVRDEKGREVYSAECNKSSGVRGTLRCAGIIGASVSVESPAEGVK